jgi:cell division protein FtsZ
MADQVLHQGVRGITDLMIMPGLINLDFADIRTVMSEMGKAMMGTGEATGERRALEAAEKAIANPLLDEVSMRGAKGVIINITGGEDLGLMEVDEAATYIRDMVDSEANIIVGSAFNKELHGIMRVSVVATGIDAAARAAAPAPVPVRKRETTDAAFPAQTSIFTTAPPVAPPVVTPEPVATTVPEPEELDLGTVGELIDDEDDLAAPVLGPPKGVEVARVSKAPEPAPVVVPIIQPVVEEERPMSLFEKMMAMSRGSKPKPAPAETLAPEPPPAADVDIPPFFKRQVNN